MKEEINLYSSEKMAEEEAYEVKEKAEAMAREAGVKEAGASHFDSAQLEVDAEILAGIKNTADFRGAVDKNAPAAERWMITSFLKKDNYTKKWLDDRERDVLKAYWPGDEDGQVSVENKAREAKRIIENTSDLYSQQGRIDVYNKRFEKYGIKYDGKTIVPTEQREAIGLIVDSKSFRLALASGNFEAAEEWLSNQKTLEKYKDMPRVLEDRRRELDRAKENK